LASGDVITAVAGVPMPDSRAILRTIIMSPENAVIPFSVWRKDQMRAVELQTVPWPHMLALRGDVLASPAAIARAEAVGLGLHLTSITPAERTHYGLASASGVLIDQVAPGSQAQAMSLNPGDVVEQVGAQQATSPAEVTAQLTPNPTEPGNLVALLVKTKSGMRWTTLWLGRIDAKDLVTGPSQPAVTGEARDVMGEAHDVTGEAHDAAGQPRAQPR
jgi:S1-C subfamily serine protease